VTSESNTYRSANELIKLHGDDAKIAAALRADACADEGDLDGAAAWLQVIDAISTLQDDSGPVSPLKCFLYES